MEQKIDEFLTRQMKKANELVEELVGRKKYYNYFDAVKVLRNFGYTKEIQFEEMMNYLPANYKEPDNIETFTKGFINDYHSYKIFAINQDHRFVIIIVASKDGVIIDRYYGETINEFTMFIYYCLDIICNCNTK